MTRNDPRDARSFLFVPGHRADRFSKAVATGADQIIIDLEDAVGSDHKTAARDATSGWLGGGGPGIVRINSVGTAWFDDDLAAVGHAGVRTIILPKASREGVAEVLHRLPSGSGVIALIETAAGVLDAAAIAHSPGLVRLALGNVDLGAEIGVNPDDRQALLLSRSTLVLASAAAGIAPPIDGVTTAVDDPDAVRADVRHAVTLGYTGKLCIHPRQVDPAHQAFRPDAQELRQAERIVAATGDGNVTVLDGKMLDKPVIDRARRLLAIADLS